LRLCTFEVGGREAPGRVEGEQVVELGASSLADYLAAGGEDVVGHALDDVRLRAPIPRPPSVRDFYAFERHVQSARAQRGLEMAPEWYQIPVFYFSNPAAVSGPADEISFPSESTAWDYELEAAAVVGGDGRIAGFTVLNDWSARDLQKMEMAVGLGPAKGKDFATSLGPVLVTPDELDDPDDIEVACHLAGEQMQHSRTSQFVFTIPQLVASLSSVLPLLPGDLIFTGTPGGVGWLREPRRTIAAGEELVTAINGIGEMRHRFVAAG
jgi:fumarylacetoacetate (FAA) hydrolase